MLKANLFFLTPLSLCYQWGVSVRNWLYDKGILPCRRVSVPVISIGNIVAGGVGKTQVVLKLAQDLKGALSLAILSRGYRSLAEKRKIPLFVETAHHTPAQCGDEPWMLAKRLPHIPIIISKKRYRGAQAACQEGIQAIILDDGMQHRALHRDIEVVVLDGENPFGGGHFLPSGRLRDSLNGLKRADLVFWVGKPSLEAKERVRNLTLAPQVEAAILSKQVLSLDGSLVPSLEGVTVGVFCGIGNPSRFVKTVEALGARVVLTCFLKDHQPISEKRLQAFAEKAYTQGVKWLLCTEKDRVKLPVLPKCPIPIGWVEAELEIRENQAAWHKLIKGIVT